MLLSFWSCVQSKGFAKSWLLGFAGYQLDFGHCCYLSFRVCKFSLKSAGSSLGYVVLGMLGNGSTTNIAEHIVGGRMCDFVRAAVMHLAWQTQFGNEPTPKFTARPKLRIFVHV